MTALALPRFVMPDPWRLLKPLRIDGQWSPRQAHQYVDADPGVHSRGTGSADVALVDDGDYSLTMDTNPTNQTISSTGPYTVAIFGFKNRNTGQTVTGVTLDGNSMTKLHGHTFNDGSRDFVTEMWGITGAFSSKTLSIAYSGTPNHDYLQLTVVSLSGLVSSTPSDTDTATGTTGDGTLSALASPGAGGIRLAALSIQSLQTFTFTNLTDVSSGSRNLSVGYDLGDDATAVTINPAGNDTFCMIGVSMR